jgi:hypothetical protein
MMILSIPLILNIDYILSIWLTEVPDYTGIFSILIIVYNLIDSLRNPLWAAVQSVGELKMFSLFGGGVFLLNFPISYIFLVNGFPPQSVFIVYIVIRIVYFFVVLNVISRLLPEFNVKNYFYFVALPLIFVTIGALMIPFMLRFFISGFCGFINVSIVSILSSMISIYCLGLTNRERNQTKNYIAMKVKKLFS